MYFKTEGFYTCLNNSNDYIISKQDWLVTWTTSCFYAKEGRLYKTMLGKGTI